MNKILLAGVAAIALNSAANAQDVGGRDYGQAGREMEIKQLMFVCSTHEETNKLHRAAQFPLEFGRVFTDSKECLRLDKGFKVVVAYTEPAIRYKDGARFTMYLVHYGAYPFNVMVLADSQIIGEVSEPPKPVVFDKVPQW